jgi:hypothetical protein
MTVWLSRSEGDELVPVPEIGRTSLIRHIIMLHQELDVMRAELPYEQQLGPDED